MRLILIILSIVTILFSCRHGGQNDRVGERGISRPAGISNDSLIDYSGLDTLLFFPDRSMYELQDLVDIVRFIKLETNEECLIGSVGKVQYVNGLFYLLDDYTGRNAIHLFDTMGNHIRSLKRIGRGPGEYKDILDFDVDENLHLFILNSIGNILVYDSLFQYIKTINQEIAIRTISVYNGCILGITDGSTYKNPKGKLFHILSSEGISLGSFLEYLGGTNINNNKSSALTKSNGKVYVNIPYSPVIFSLDSVLNAKAEYYLMLQYSLSDGSLANRFQKDESKDFILSDKIAYCSFTLPVRTTNATRNLIFSGFSGQEGTLFPVNMAGRISDGTMDPFPLMGMTSDGIGVTVLDADYLRGSLELECARVITDSAGIKQRVYSRAYLGSDTLPGSLYDKIRSLDENDNPCIVMVRIKPFSKSN